MTKEEIIKQATAVHGDKYDYSKVEYENKKTKICIICPEHGEFWQTPSKHLLGQGCPKCAGRHKTNEELIDAFIKVHGDKYDYSKMRFNKMHEKVCVVCPKHGDFYVTPSNHLNNRGCPICKAEKLSKDFSMPLKTFIDKSEKKHGNKYDYSKVEYVNNTTPVKIVCPTHGEFLQTPASHLRGRGCLKCSSVSAHKKFVKPKDKFIEEAILVHKNKYDYSKVEYENNKTKVCIICPEHGEFWQTPTSHLSGRGCKLCNKSHLENEIESNLPPKTFIREKRFKWLNGLSLDFYLPEYNAAIECQGIQHFKDVEFFGMKDPFKNRVERDIRKKKLCGEHGVNIYYFSHEKIDEFLGNKVYHSVEEILEAIKNEERLL